MHSGTLSVTLTPYLSVAPPTMFPGVKTTFDDMFMQRTLNCLSKTYFTGCAQRILGGKNNFISLFPFLSFFDQPKNVNKCGSKCKTKESIWIHLCLYKILLMVKHFSKCLNNSLLWIRSSRMEAALELLPVFPQTIVNEICFLLLFKRQINCLHGLKEDLHDSG